jgi:hypothetical protein
MNERVKRRTGQRGPPAASSAIGMGAARRRDRSRRERQALRPPARLPRRLRARTHVAHSRARVDPNARRRDPAHRRPGRLQAPLTTARPSRAARGPRRQGRERKHRPQHLFGDVPVSAMKPEWTPETMPDHFQLMSGTFLEIGPVHVLASGSVDHLRRLQGGTAQIDRRRFRTSIYIDSPTRGGGSSRTTGPAELCAWAGTWSSRTSSRPCGASHQRSRRRSSPATSASCARSPSTTAAASVCTHPCLRPAPFASATRSHCSVEDGAEVGPATAGCSFFLVPNLVPDAADLTLAGPAEPRRSGREPAASRADTARS